MTLAKRMTLQSLGLSTMLVILATSSAWSLLATQKSVRIARDEYLELRMILKLDEHLAALRSVIDVGGDPQSADAELDAAVRQMQSLLGFQTQQYRDVEPHEEEEGGYLRALEADLADMVSFFDTHTEAAGATGVLASLTSAQSHLRDLATEMDEAIASAQHESNRILQVTLVVLILISATTMGATVLVNIAQYRSVVVPVRRLRDGVRTLASGRFDKRLPEGRGHDDEFGELARDFNQMAAELDDLYRDLELRVREKSRELVRSERLASVGFLAAGVAHEINNPLNIISGHAELTLRRVRKLVDASEHRDTEQALRIIRDESFRCKGIIEKLLSLSAGGGAERERVALDQIVDDVATMLRSLTQYRDRNVSVDIAPGSDVLGNETELRQVVLNLAINALEAVEPPVGEVRLEGIRHNGTIELVVSDNGHGMTSETQEHVFDPFFTQRTSTTKRGLGLGLSITHAIVESHGGRITAYSDGPNQGSRFAVELPVFNYEAAQG